MSRHWASTREAGVMRGLQLMIWVNKHAGRWAFNIVLVFVMAYFFLRRGDARRASFDYLARVRREYPKALGRGPLLWWSYCHFFIFGQSLLDKYLAWAETPDGILMSPDEEKRLFDFVETGRGCLLIGSHFGNLEYSRGIAHRHPDVTINVLIYDQHAQNFAALLAEGDPDSRMNLIQVTDVDINLALKLKEKVGRGEWVVIAGDRVPVGDSERVTEARFIGDMTRFPIGPYVLATLLQCPVFLLHCFRLDGNYRLGYEHFAEQIGADRKLRERAYTDSAQAFATALEKQVIRAPLQWFNFFDFWGRPESSVDDESGQ
jgi:predicted LPLAT superfamily acyltransferase